MKKKQTIIKYKAIAIVLIILLVGFLSGAIMGVFTNLNATTENTTEYTAVVEEMSEEPSEEEKESGYFVTMSLVGYSNYIIMAYSSTLEEDIYSVLQEGDEIVYRVMGTENALFDFVVYLEANDTVIISFESYNARATASRIQMIILGIVILVTFSTGIVVCLRKHKMINSESNFQQ